MLAKFCLVLVEFMLLASFLVFMIVSRTKSVLKVQNDNFEQQIAAQSEHYRELAAANAEVRRFKHDFKNLRFAIEQLLSDGKKSEAQAIMQEFTETLNSTGRSMILFDTGNGIADALLMDKLRQAHQKQTLLTFKGAIPQNALAPTDLCVLLGNTIDNAIEACEKLPAEYQREITVECNCSSGFLFLTVRNPISKPVPICDHMVPSTKKDKALHGFGIQSLHKVAKNYDGTVKLNSDGGDFTVNVELYLPAMDRTLAG